MNGLTTFFPYEEALFFISSPQPGSVNRTPTTRMACILARCVQPPAQSRFRCQHSRWQQVLDQKSCVFIPWWWGTWGCSHSLECTYEVIKWKMLVVFIQKGESCVKLSRHVVHTYANLSTVSLTKAFDIFSVINRSNSKKKKISSASFCCIPTNLAFHIPRPPLIDNLVSDGSCPPFTSRKWDTHIMVSAATKQSNNV